MYLHSSQVTRENQPPFSRRLAQTIAELFNLEAFLLVDANNIGVEWCIFSEDSDIFLPLPNSTDRKLIPTQKPVVLKIAGKDL